MKILSFISLIGLMALTSACGQNLSKDPGAQNNVNLIRQFQRVITYDCAHNVKSDSIETVQSPTAWVKIVADNPNGLGNVTFYDQTTQAYAGTIIDNASFVVDYSYGALSMHVVSGPNTIEYTFYNCDLWGTNSSGNQVCQQATTVREHGTLTLNVTYEEQHLDGVSEVVDCPSPTPVPSPTPN